MVDHDAVRGRDEQVAGFAELDVGQIAQDIALLQVDGARDHELRLAGAVQHRLRDGHLRQAVEPVAVRLRNHPGIGCNRVLKVRAVLDVDPPDLSRTVEVGHQIAIEIEEGDVVEGASQGLVLFEEVLQRRGVGESLGPDALGKGLQQDPPADEPLIHRIRDGRHARELLARYRRLQARLDQLQRDGRDRECRCQDHRRDAKAEARVQADAAVRWT